MALTCWTRGRKPRQLFAVEQAMTGTAMARRPMEVAHTLVSRRSRKHTYYIGLVVRRAAPEDEPQHFLVKMGKRQALDWRDDVLMMRFRRCRARY